MIDQSKCGMERGNESTLVESKLPILCHNIIFFVSEITFFHLSSVQIVAVIWSPAFEGPLLVPEVKIH